MKLRFLTATCMFFASNGVFDSGVHAANFGEDITFLKKYTDLIVLSDSNGEGKVALAPAWQGRVMTSTADGDAGLSFGWINRELIASKKIQPHINVFGGEDRFWMGPEGGQFSIFFAKGAKFELADWQTPAVIDTVPFEVVGKSRSGAVFTAKFPLDQLLRHEVRRGRGARSALLDSDAAWERLGVQPPRGVRLVAYESDNQITNAGQEAWKKETGLLSIWILGMFNPSPSTTIVVPIKQDRKRNWA